MVSGSSAGSRAGRAVRFVPVFIDHGNAIRGAEGRARAEGSKDAPPVEARNGCPSQSVPFEHLGTER